MRSVVMGVFKRALKNVMTMVFEVMVTSVMINVYGLNVEICGSTPEKIAMMAIKMTQILV